jgi:hypothetical protein
MSAAERIMLANNARVHLAALMAVIDALERIGADRELADISHRLMQLSFRASPSIPSPQPEDTRRRQ